MTIKRIGIFGLGAVGAVYGGLLQSRNEYEVEIIVDETRKHRYEVEGISVNDKKIPFQYVTNNKNKEVFDVIIIAVKYGQLQEAIKAIKDFVSEQTTIMPLLNGITSEEEIAAVYGKEKVLYAICNGIDAIRKKHAVFYTNPGIISFGEKKNVILTKRVKEIRMCLEQANIPVEVPEDMERTLWYKFMINVGMNQASAVTRASYGYFQKEGYAKELAKSSMLEVIALAEAQNIALSKEDMNHFFVHVLSKMGRNGKTSMLQDVEAKRPTEVAMFAEKVIQYGEKFNVPTPVNRTLYRIIKTLEETNKKHWEKALSQDPKELC